MYPNTDDKRLIIGVDPGTQTTGYAILEIRGRKMIPIDFGCIRPPRKTILLSDRYLIIHQSIETLLNKFKPQEMAIEMPFYAENIQSTIKLGMAISSIIIPAKERLVPIFGYSPRQVKQAVAGTGKATKEQIQATICRYLGLAKKIEPHDAADAIAIAICHAYAKNENAISKIYKEI